MIKFRDENDQERIDELGTNISNENTCWPRRGRQEVFCPRYLESEGDEARETEAKDLLLSD